MCAEFTPPSVVYGVVYGGNSRGSWGSDRPDTWVTRAVATDDALRVDRCAPVRAWFDDEDANASADGGTSTSASASEPPDGCPTLTTFLADLPSTAAVGLDFPFGLPDPVVAEPTWTAFLRDLPTWCNSPTDLRWRCERRLDLDETSAEARLRATDEPLSALSPFDERIAASTFFGLRDVLRPLVLSDQMRVPPMTSPRPDRPFAIEVYPAGTLADLALDSFDGDAGERETGPTRGEAMLERFSETVDCDLDVATDVHDRVVAEDAALESLVAAYAVYRNTRSVSSLSVSDPQRLIEGQVFV